ncbi:WhiB family transcriptional regulator [Actinopolymorpha cephalotaxi]|uniref:WhiB family transcriptional regulator n=1 Tax=Actinopolymorpha cephalotaxi TaxID=504797 RepID=UPI000B83D245
MRLTTSTSLPDDWQYRPCLGTPMELWFGPEDDSTEEVGEQVRREKIAADLCAGCPFNAQCLAAELSRPASHQWGVRGGLTARQRKAMVHARRRAEVSTTAA